MSFNSERSRGAGEKGQYSVGLAVGHAAGGILNSTAFLADALVQHRRVFALGPKTLPNRMTQPQSLSSLCLFRGTDRSWGLNQWMFLVWSAFWAVWKRWTVRNCVLHFHNPTLARPDIFTAHGLYTRNWLSKPKRGWLARIQFRLLSAIERRLISRGARQVVFVSQEDRAYVEKAWGRLSDERVSVVGPGVDFERLSFFSETERVAARRVHFPELHSNAKWMLFVGHDFDGKGLLRILHALAERVHSYSAAELQFMVFGRDSCHSEVANLVAKRCGADVVRFIENDSTLAAAYACADFLVMDAKSEGFPLVLREAQAAGCIPIVTAFGGVTEAIVSGQTGFIEGNATAIVDRVLEWSAASNAEQLSVMRKTAHDSVRPYSWGAVANAYEAIYSRL